MERIKSQSKFYSWAILAALGASVAVVFVALYEALSTPTLLL